jgi:hypothetical protein
MPTRDKGKLDAILTAIVTRLQSSLGVAASDCYLAMSGDILPTPAPAPGDFLYIVSPLSGDFDESYFDGGEGNQCTIRAGFTVRVHSTVQEDQPGQDTLFLTDSTRGIIDRWRLVVKALAAWSPLDNSSNPLTRDPIIPKSFSMGRADRSLGDIEIAFNLTFDLDLS